VALLSIIEPAAIVAIGGTIAGADRLVLPNPREASGRFAISSPRTIDLDLGQVRSINTIFLGFVFATAFPNCTVSYGQAGFTESNLPALVAAPSDGSPFGHYFMQLAAAINARYVRITATLPAGATIGNVAVGTGFSPIYGHEYGSGRGVTDTGTVTRLQDGSFGIDDGVTVGSYAWTFGDLTDAETAYLYLLQRRKGIRRTVLVVEDVATTAGLCERIHWGLLTKLENYERLTVNATRWAMQVDDWM
jgi:hypothetical protein